ncbi:MAG TPA: hypothetical protein VF590_24880 [Isosphaeraceae bacterium]
MRRYFDHRRDIEGHRYWELPGEDRRIRVMVLTAIAAIAIHVWAYFRFPFF